MPSQLHSAQFGTANVPVLEGHKKRRISHSRSTVRHSTSRLLIPRSLRLAEATFYHRFEKAFFSKAITSHGVQSISGFPANPPVKSASNHIIAKGA